MRRIVLALLALAFPAAVLGGEGTKLRYGTKDIHDDIAGEMSLSITIEGTDAATNFVRSMHPLLSLSSLHMKAEGTHRVSKKKNTVANEDVRVHVRYDDEDHDWDFKAGEVPQDLEKSKLQQLVWAIAVLPKTFDLSARGEFRADDPGQDQNGEAMALYVNGITRMPDEPVAQGATYTKEWNGSRSEKGKKAVFAFKQAVTVEKVEEKDGRTLATLVSELTGVVQVPEGEKNPAAEEAWTRCTGTTRTVLEHGSGRVLLAEGKGRVVSYFKNTADDGGRNEVTITFAVEGKRSVRK